MTKLKQVQSDAVGIIIKDEGMVRFIQEKNEPVFEIINPKKEHYNPHPLLEVEIALRGCEISGVFNKQNEK